MSEVRLLAADDWAQLRAARLMALSDAPYAFSSTVAMDEQYTEQIWRERAGSGRAFAAWDSDAIVGMASGLPIGGGEWHLVGMWVAPARRGTGLADQLAAAVCDLAMECTH